MKQPISREIPSADEADRPWRRTPHAIREELADLLKQAYADERSGWHRSRGGPPGRGRLGRRWDDVWPKMADFVLKNRIDNYRMFIHLQFTSHGNLACCPSPRQCYGPAALRRWQQAQAKQDDAAAEHVLALRFQVHRMHGALAQARRFQPQSSDRDIEEYVLLDDSNKLTALFRYCGAVKAEHHHAAAEFRDGALLQYALAADLYDRVWGDLIPESLKQEAAAMRLSPCQ